MLEKRSGNVTQNYTVLATAYNPPAGLEKAGLQQTFAPVAKRKWVKSPHGLATVCGEQKAMKCHWPPKLE
jgi:hypothetical protein